MTAGQGPRHSGGLGIAVTPFHLLECFSMTPSFFTVARFAALATATVAVLAAAPAVAQTTDTGGPLRDGAGKTLYTFDKDAANESRCFDACAFAGPQFMASDGAKAQGKLALIARMGGGLQWALDGKPLYFFAGDAKPGDVNGDGSGDVWRVVKTGAAEKRAAAPAAPGYGSSSTY
jgi:predicted lipoprotein with Yx(FWY)xxD motif